jgi:hypothetical protein
MPRFTCPFEGVCKERNDGKFFNKQNTLTAHYCACHLTAAEVDYALPKLIPDYKKQTTCWICPVKNKCDTRRVFLGHWAHKHCTEKQLEFIHTAFFPAAKETEPLAAAAELHQVHAAVQEKFAKKQASEAALKQMKDDVDKVAMVEDDEDGYESGASNTSHKSRKGKDGDYDPEAIKNPILGDPKKLESLNKTRMKMFPVSQYEDYLLFVDEPDAYYVGHPHGGHMDYLNYLTELKKQTDQFKKQNEEAKPVDETKATFGKPKVVVEKEDNNFVDFSHSNSFGKPSK